MHCFYIQYQFIYTDLLVQSIIIIIMIFNLQKLTHLRRKLHAFPEIGFQQFQTQKLIIASLIQFGIPQSDIKIIAKTGVILDLNGTAQSSHKNKVIAFRADMDGLCAQENNIHLSYRSMNKGISHACGHDGHIVWLLGFVMKFLEEKDKLPKDITFRVLFQPSQQGPLSGAKTILEEGHLDGVHQIYGVHNIPNKTKQRIWIKQGAILSQGIILKLSIKGTSGHSSNPQSIKNALREGVRFYNYFYQFSDKLREEKRKITAELAMLNCGQRYNVFSEECKIEGTIRSFEPNTYELFKAKIDFWVKQIEERGFKVICELNSLSPVTINTLKQSKNVLRAAESYLGKENVGIGMLPLNASEDFAYYTQKIPGAFFCISTTNEVISPPNHSNDFDFNDQFIELGAEFWWRLAMDRAFHD